MEPLTINVAGSYPIKFRGICSTGPELGKHQNGMGLDIWTSWDGKAMFCGGVMAHEDVLKLKEHIEDFLMRRAELLGLPPATTSSEEGRG